jgi:hypothetical protein
MGSGKWASLIYSKLSNLDIDSSIIGSNKELCNFSRNEIYACQKNCPVIIASSTISHLSDLELSLKLDPSIIYIEKGFYTLDEYEKAKEQVNVPIYFLSQYRYSAVFKILSKLQGKIKKIDYTWKIDRSTISEWVYHILSIDNFIKNKNNKMITTDEGIYRIDDISDFEIKKSDDRQMIIDIESSEYLIQICLGKTNSISILENGITKKIDFQNEDCLFKQLRDIFIFKENSVLERL